MLLELSKGWRGVVLLNEPEALCGKKVEVVGLRRAHEAWIGSAPAPFHAAGGAATEVRPVSNCAFCFV